MNNKPYFKALHKDEKNDLLEMLAKRKYKISIWEKGTKKIEYFNVLKLNEKSTLFVDMIESKTELLNKNVLACFNFDNTHYFTQCKLSSEGALGSCDYYINVEETIFKCEKRNSFRIDTDNKYPIKFTINDRVYSALNTSVGGVGLIIEGKDQESFSEGLKFADCILDLNSSEYKISSCEVVHITPIPSKNTVRLGIKFSMNSIEMEKKLYQQINRDFINMNKEGIRSNKRVLSF
ncbi:MAG: PilZ domain-containing protein [Oligoflexia bacterium]|nr:PilZ domain-containing protein [Oligoflexia bacterium]